MGSKSSLSSHPGGQGPSAARSQRVQSLQGRAECGLPPRPPPRRTCAKPAWLVPRAGLDAWEADASLQRDRQRARCGRCDLSLAAGVRSQRAWYDIPPRLDFMISFATDMREPTLPLAQSGLCRGFSATLTVDHTLQPAVL